MAYYLILSCISQLLKSHRFTEMRLKPGRVLMEGPIITFRGFCYGPIAIENLVSICHGKRLPGEQGKGGQEKGFKDVLKASLMKCNIPTASWESLVLDFSEWRRSIWDNVESLTGSTQKQWRDSRPQTTHPLTHLFCGRVRGSHVDSISHLRTHRTRGEANHPRSREIASGKKDIYW